MASSENLRILVTGSLGQIGSELAVSLSESYGSDNIVLSDIREKSSEKLTGYGEFIKLDVVSRDDFRKIVSENGINRVYHLAAMLSAVAEAEPRKAWKVNMEGLVNALEICSEYGCSLFVPSSIGAFGPDTPLDNTPQDTIMRPHSMYGVTKVSGELLCDYYHLKYGVDARGVRYPGIISSATLPGGGTTDYAVQIFYAAVKKGSYTCYLRPDTSLDMMYMPDAIKAAIDIMEADSEKLEHRNAFNVTAMHFTPERLAEAIREHLPGFEIEYRPDPLRQGIADSWPNYMDDSAARNEWGWEPEYDIDAMVADMLRVLSRRHEEGKLDYTEGKS
ncbi:MAG: NAD-dependent epimerase/dehydratase family protein [Candidatus Latescibacteria bacterium]|nr:NAD-dependent epimerase/dehydratase family protein [bacterium]MBD3422844.1 NAD-dependent epimerase/dehydratase family protein [Candidatus Latescibacterota bacterium]